MLFLGISMVESNFFVLHWEKDQISQGVIGFWIGRHYRISDWKASYNQSSTYSFNNSFIKAPILPTRPIA